MLLSTINTQTVQSSSMKINYKMITKQNEKNTISVENLHPVLPEQL